MSDMVCEDQLLQLNRCLSAENVDAAIDAWKQTLEIAPSADAHTSEPIAVNLSIPGRSPLDLR